MAKRKSNSTKKSTRRSRRPRPKRGGKIPRCMQEYALSQSDVWALTDLPCVPDNRCRPTFRFAHRTRGTFNAGTTGYGWVAARPLGVSTNATSVLYTQADSVGGGNTSLQTFTNQGQATGTGCPYNSADLTTGDAKLRIVGAQLRMRDINPALTRKGRVWAFKDPANQNVVNQDSNEIMAQLACSITTAEKAAHRWVTCTWHPVSGADYDFTNRDTTDVLACGVNGAEPGATFEFQFLAYYEVIAENGIGATTVTASEAYPEAMSKVLAAVQSTFSSSSDLLKKIAFGALSAYYGGAVGTALGLIDTTEYRPMIMDVD